MAGETVYARMPSLREAMLLILAVRLLHVFCAASWFGMVVAVNFVLVPALLKTPE